MGGKENMKNLQFKKGAIVKFNVLGCSPLAGRVTNITETEVEICYQQKVSNTGNFKESDIPFDQNSITADTDYFATIDRDKICKWEYFRFSSQAPHMDTCFCKSAEEFNALHINHYKNGICTGEDEGGGSCSSETSKVDGTFAGEFKGSFFD